MYPSVRCRFSSFNVPIEGNVSYMYGDIDGHVTVGIGSMIDSVMEAQDLAFRFKQKSADQQKVPGIPGALATRDQKAAEWHRVKNVLNQKETQNPYGAQYYEKITDLELSPEAIDQLMETQLLNNESSLRSWPSFKDYDRWPADAQLGLLSMAWALGVGPKLRKFSNFLTACASQDFDLAAAECHIKSDKNLGVEKRNKANFVLFSNAARVLERPDLYNLSTLYKEQSLCNLPARK